MNNSDCGAEGSLQYGIRKILMEMESGMRVSGRFHLL